MKWEWKQWFSGLGAKFGSEVDYNKTDVKVDTNVDVKGVDAEGVDKGMNSKPVEQVGNAVADATEQNGAATASYVDQATENSKVLTESTNKLMHEAGEGIKNGTSMVGTGAKLAGGGIALGGAGAAVQGMGAGIAGVAEAVGDKHLKDAQADSIKKKNEGEMKIKAEEHKQQTRAAAVEHQVIEDKARQQLSESEIQAQPRMRTLVERRTADGMDLLREAIETHSNDTDWAQTRIIVAVIADGDAIRAEARRQIQPIFDDYHSHVIALVPTHVGPHNPEIDAKQIRAHHAVYRSSELSEYLQILDQFTARDDGYPWRIYQSLGVSGFWLKRIISYYGYNFFPNWTSLSEEDKQRKVLNTHDQVRAAKTRTFSIILMLSERVGETRGVFPMNPVAIPAALTSSLGSWGASFHEAGPRLSRKITQLRPDLRILAPQRGGQPSVIIRSRVPTSAAMMYLQGDLATDSSSWLKALQEKVYAFDWEEDSRARRVSLWSSHPRARKFAWPLSRAFVSGIAFQERAGAPLYWPDGTVVDDPVVDATIGGTR